MFDICQALIASMRSPSPGAIYNIADDDPTSREDVLRFVRETLLIPAETAGSEDSLDTMSQQRPGISDRLLYFFMKPNACLLSDLTQQPFLTSTDVVDSTAAWLSKIS